MLQAGLLSSSFINEHHYTFEIKDFIFIIIHFMISDFILSYLEEYDKNDKSH